MVPCQNPLFIWALLRCRNYQQLCNSPRCWFTFGCLSFNLAGVLASSIFFFQWRLDEGREVPWLKLIYGDSLTQTIKILFF